MTESKSDIVLWQNSYMPVLPRKVNNITELVEFGLQLSKKDQKQIVTAFENESFEMLSTYIWTKSINTLKSQLSKMGVAFIAEMLDRPDITDTSNIQQAISEFEAIRLAEELGVISGTAAFRLKQAMETVAHFNQSDLGEEFQEDEMSEDETKMIVRSCIQGVLGYGKIEAVIDFKNFRNRLEEETLLDDDVDILKLVQSPYFFHRTTLRILLSIVKVASGAHLENALANSNLIIPKIWDQLKHPEKYQVGRGYAELFADGKTKASSGIKQVLLKVKGFDFVPEDLRSSTFIKVANEILIAHEGVNNFYNEPAPVRTLSRMGSVIPAPALSVCMTAILSVILGNRYGVSNAAQGNARQILSNVTHDRWVYYFKDCLEADERILYKLTLDYPVDRWLKLFSSDFMEDMMTRVSSRRLTNMLKFMKEGKRSKIKSVANQMYSKLGYSNK